MRRWGERRERLSGRIGSLTVEAAARRVERGTHAFSVRITTTSSLNLDLSIAREGLLERATSAFRRGNRADRLVGDPEFDASFDVRTSIPAVLAGTVDAEVREAIQTCAARARQLRFHDLGADLEGPCDPGT